MTIALHNGVLQSSNGTFSHFFEKTLYPFHILDARRCLESAVDINTGKAGMVEFFQSFDTVRIDTAAKQERGTADVTLQNAPVELLSGTTIVDGTRIEQIVVAETFIIRYGKKILGQGDGKRFDDPDTI